MRFLEKLREYATKNKISISKLIENYLHNVTTSTPPDIEISLLVKSLTGVIELENEDYKKQYSNFLTNKYSR